MAVVVGPIQSQRERRIRSLLRTPTIYPIGAGLSPVTPTLTSVAGQPGGTDGYVVEQRSPTRPLFAFYGRQFVVGADASRPTAVRGESDVIRVAFYTDAPDVWVHTNGNGSPFHVLNVLIDGKYISKTEYSPTIGQSVSFTKIALGSSAWRRIDVELSGLYFYGVRLPTGTYSLYPVEQAEPVVTFVGDSYFGRTGATQTMLGLMQTACYVLGWDGWYDTADSGGTGYVSNLNSTNKRFIDRLPLISTASRGLVVAGGINDTSFGAAAIQAAAVAYLAAARARLPNTPVVTLGSWPANTGPNAETIAADNAVRAAVSGLNDPLIRHISVAADGWVTGTGRTGTTNGSGNADLYQGGADATDGLHPTQAGHDYLGRRAAYAIRSALGDMLAAVT